MQPRTTLALTAFAWALALSLPMTDGAESASRMRSDAPLLAALRADRTLSDCKCLVAADWINQSYARITVTANGWQRLKPSERRRFCSRALSVTEATYLREFAAADQYEVLYVYDQRGRLLVTYKPR